METSAKLPPWGEESVALDFPGGPYILYGLSETQAADLRNRFLEDGIQPGNSLPGMPIEVCRGPDPLQSRRIMESGEYSLDFSHDHHALSVNGLGFSGSVDFDPMTSATISTPVNEPGNTWPVFENFLRLLVAYRLLDGHGLMLHSAAIVLDGNAYFGRREIDAF
jgi:hypothetical protein